MIENGFISGFDVSAYFYCGKMGVCDVSEQKQG